MSRATLTLIQGGRTTPPAAEGDAAHVPFCSSSEAVERFKRMLATEQVERGSIACLSLTASMLQAVMDLTFECLGPTEAAELLSKIIGKQCLSWATLKSATPIEEEA